MRGPGPLRRYNIAVIPAGFAVSAMAAALSYTPDAHRLAAALPAIYAERRAYRTLDAARRIAATATELLDAEPPDAVPGNSVDPALLNTAALFLRSGAGDDTRRFAESAAIAGAWLRGAAAPEAFIDAVTDAILTTGRHLPETAPAPAAGDGNPARTAAYLLWHAALLDLSDSARHSDWLGGMPESGQERDNYRSTYRQECLIPALLLDQRLTMPAAVEIYRIRLPQLAAFLDGPGRVLAPPDWRRLAEVDAVRQGVARLLAGEDPAQVKSEMPAPGLPYAEYREQQRAVIAASHDGILQLTHDRIEASRRVAVEKYLESDTIHKPAVEENLFVSARRRSRQLGLSAETAEDIARLLLSNARAVQERTLNDIAQQLSRRHGQILDADAPATSAEEADIAIPSLVIRTGDQPLARENELIKELRITGLNEAYPEQRRHFLQWFDTPHPYMATGQIVGSRDADLFLQGLFLPDRTGGESGKPPGKVIATMSAAGPMHLGHGAVANLLRYFQSLGTQVAIGFRDDFRDGRSAAADSRRAMRDRLLTMAASGLDLSRTDAWHRVDRPAIMETALALGDAIPLSVLNSALGLRLRDSATATFLPLLRLADVLHQQQPEYGGPGRTLVIDGIGGDVYVRMARNVSEKFGFIKPSALYVRMVRSLATYRDPDTGSAVEAMTGRVPQGSIAYDADADAVRRRISRAYTGGRRTQAEQRRQGGNPDPRICAVSGLHAFYATPDPAEYAELQRRCRAGALLCGECKAAAADKMVEYLAEQRRRRDALPESARRRANRLAGLPEQAD